MPAYMSGVRGGVKGSVRDESRLEFLHSALSGLLATEEIEREVRSSTDGRVITMVINNACNLACRHCYLQVERLTAAELSAPELAQVFWSAFALDPALICLSGKEIFLGDRGAEALNQLTNIKREMQSETRIGAITNGTLIHKHREAILAADLDNLDISVDGIEAGHDHNRGLGAFAAMRPNLEWATRELGDRLFVNMTLQKRNFLSLIPAVEQFHRFGVRTVGCGFYSPLPYTDPSMRMNDADFTEVFRSLGRLDDIFLTHPLTVLVEVDTLCLSAMTSFLRSAWFNPERIRVDERGDFYCESLLKNGLRLQIRFSPFPQLLFRSARVTVEGEYLTAEDTVNTRLYAKHSLGNVRDFGCDLVAMQPVAAQSPRVAALFGEYFGKTLPLLQQEYLARVSRSPFTKTETAQLEYA